MASTRDKNYYRALMGGDDDSNASVPVLDSKIVLPTRKKKFNIGSETHDESAPPQYQYKKHADKPLTSWSSAFIADKPQPVQERVIKLFSLQHSYTELMMQYQEEALALERKYQALLQPLYIERAETVSGLRDHCSTPDGIPDFWLQAMKNEPSIAELIAPRDEHVLSELKDVKIESLPSGERGFILVFSFGENPYFSNDILTKTYVYTRAADTDDSVEDIYSSEYTYHLSIGDIIHWKEGCNLIDEREEDKDGDQQESFFAFFSPPVMPDEEEEESEEMRTFEWLRELDFDYGEVFKEKIIPYAVHWYTGEATLYEDDSDDSDDSDEEGDDEDDEDGGDGSNDDEGYRH